jgi:hypothetical protein
MRDVTIRSRADGIIELVPRLAPLKSGERAVVIVTVLFLTFGLFVGGVLPGIFAIAVAASCVAGEVVLGVKAAALALRRPLAPVHEVRRFRRRIAR